MLYAFGFENIGVVVSDLYFLDPTPGPGQEGAERGVRLEVRMLDRGDLKGSIYSAQPIGVDRPIWRADLLESVAGPFGSFDRTHHHPAFNGWEPSRRHYVPELSADPLGWVGATAQNAADPRRIPGTAQGWLLKVFGILLTGLAISQGSPFWFDLLNKFIIVRSTVKPAEKKDADGRA